MAKDDDLTPVMFRKDKKTKEVYAIFPEIMASEQYVQTYEHIGQHGSGNLLYMISSSVPATPKEYASLKKELEEIGYRVKPVLKDTEKFRKVREKIMVQYLNNEIL